jgi:hypothetical protein
MRGSRCGLATRNAAGAPALARTESLMRLPRLLDFFRRTTVEKAGAPVTSKAAAIRALHKAIGADDFYARVARIDVDHAVGWMQMVEVQESFKDAESDPTYDAEMRTYSASNRETLHRAMIALLESPPDDNTVYDAFIELHPALFRENGACELDPRQSMLILANTEPAMLSFSHQSLLLEGVVNDRRWSPLVRAAADATRAARAARGEPITARRTPHVAAF